MEQGIFFDLDGTLVDTEGLAVDVTREWLVARGHAVTPELERVIVGRTWALAAKLLHEGLMLKTPAATLEAELVAAYRDRTAAGVVSLPGAAAFVRSVAARYRLFVVSGSPRRDIEHALASLAVTDCFERWFGAEDYPHSKPAPDPYLAALTYSGLRREAVVVFEDSEAGIASAAAAGLRTIVVTGAQVREPVNAAGLVHIRDFTGLDAAWLQAL